MTKSDRLTGMLLALGVLALAACSANLPDLRTHGANTPTPSPTKRELCQPFPDRLIDDFVAAYNGRDLEGLERLVTASSIEDLLGAAYTEDASFEDVREWAEASWDAGDRIRLTGYSAFSPTKWGFQMHVSRGSATLRAHRIERVSMTLNAISDGCAITSLTHSGPIQAKERPCAFYDAFAASDEVASDEPQVCEDGSGAHARTGASAVFTGTKMLVWGGHRGGEFTYGDIAMDGLSFAPASRRWSGVPAPDLPDFRADVSVWTGRELLLFGPKTRPHYRIVGAAYDPEARAWRVVEFPYKRWSGFEGVWTGRELVLWGGPRSEHPRQRGALYDPASDTWRQTSPAPIGGRWSHSVTWTGRDMIVWGGSDANTDLADGAAYDPVTDSWRTIAPAPISARQWMPITWTETEMIVWGGSSYSRNRADGAAYNPVTDSWRKLPPSPLRGRHYHSAVWAGEELIVYGGYNYERSFSDGAAYDPVSDSWRRLPRAPIKRRFEHSAVWTGNEMFVFGGTWDFGHIALGDGALYDPDANRWRRVIPFKD